MTLERSKRMNEAITIIPAAISSQDINQFYQQLNAIRNDADKKIVKEVITATPVLMSVQSQGMIKGMAQAQMILVYAAYVEFECTIEHAKSFQTQSKLKLA